MKKPEDLAVIRENMYKEINIKDRDDDVIRIVVGMATCGIAAGARPVYEAFKTAVEEAGLTNVQVIQTGCIGVCRFEPLAEVHAPGQDKVTYVKLTPDMIPEIIEEHIKGKQIVKKYTIGAAEISVKKGEEPDYSDVITNLDETVFMKKQTRIALRNCGVIDPENIDEYLATGGYTALERVISGMTPDQVIDELLASGLRGRGGAGFPTGRKWQFTKDATSDDGVKFVCCNADEGDPGAFMDRSVLEGDPLSVVEAMTIAGYTIGSEQGYIYVRAEYPVAIKRLQIAIEQAKKYGLLGKNILGTDFNFDLELRLGAGAFVCGEETALMTSIEGKRGEPHPRPPFPAIKGLFQKPTLLNNVETYANITWIINNGADKYSAIGTEKSAGTKVFALGGKITNTGLIEIPMGTTLRTVVEEIGGGVPKGKEFKAAQTGGPSGGCIPAKYIDIPLDFESLGEIGSIIGSGGLIVMDQDNCMVDIAKFFLEFIVDESCGKCVPCRIGTKRLHGLLEKITRGQGTMEDLETVEELCNHVKANALCGLGQTAPNPVLSTMRHFRDEYEEHVNEKRCRAGVCKSLVEFVIIADKCKGCSICTRNCPADAINGVIREPHVIDMNKCLKCGTCLASCKFGAIVKR